MIETDVRLKVTFVLFSTDEDIFYKLGYIL